jgi:tetratricopeptide (TPR) repeat protein
MQCAYLGLRSTKRLGGYRWLARRTRTVVLSGALAALVSIGLSTAAFAADLDALRGAVKKDPSDPQAALALGKALRRAGELGEARGVLSRGALAPAAHKEGVFEALLYELALTQVDRNDMAGANVACKQLATAGKTAIAAACRAEVHMMRNRATEALPEVEQALASEPSLYEAKVLKARVLAFQQKFEHSLRLAEEAAKASPSRAEAHATLGSIKASMGKPADAVAHFQKARALDPDHALLAFQLGEALQTGAKAKQAFADAVALRPSYAAAHAGLARVAIELGDLALAEKSANAALAIAPHDYASVVALGQVRIAQKKWSEALKLGQKAQKLIPNMAGGELVVADAHAGNGDIDLAVEAYQKAFGLDRERPDALIRAARACRGAGRTTTTRGFADLATSDFPKSGPAWAELAEVAIAAGEKKQAKAAIQKALKLGNVDESALKQRLAGLGG